MHLLRSKYALRSPVMVSAFAGWNDAAEAATNAVSHLLKVWDSHLIAEVDVEDYYDFQVNRPTIKVDEQSLRRISWPTTSVYEVTTPHLAHDFLVVNGIEPSMRWQSFSKDLLDLADDYEVETSITFGSLLADTPHTRPIVVTTSGANPEISNRLGISISKYEGPTGIVGVLQDFASKRDIDALSLWASVPHYVSTPPCPKASLALVNALEDFLSIEIPLLDLTESASNWENQVNKIAREDNEIGEYVKELEKSKDAADLPEITGDSIAREVERFLRSNPEV
ncbi:MAG: PAC2 family protein [Actinomycetales bacterium]